MTVLLYAVTESGASLAGQGLDGRPLREITDEGLAAVVSDHEQSPAPTEPNLWAYEHVVEQLMACTPVVPARFGATAEHDEEVHTMLLSRHDELRSALDRVAGAVEFAVHAPTVAAGAASTAVRTNGTASGTDYMLTRLAEQRRARELTAKIDAAVGDVVRGRTSLTRASDRLAYLVDRDDIDRFLARLITVDEPDITWAGPWPPYSFIRPGEAR